MTGDLECGRKWGGTYTQFPQTRNSPLYRTEAPHGSEDIPAHCQHHLLAYCTRPFVPAGFQVVGVARSVASSDVGERSGARHLRVPGVRGIQAGEKALVQLPSGERR
jgi:hypothetical protein